MAGGPRGWGKPSLNPRTSKDIEGHSTRVRRNAELIPKQAPRRFTRSPKSPRGLLWGTRGGARISLVPEGSARAPCAIRQLPLMCPLSRIPQEPIADLSMLPESPAHTAAQMPSIVWGPLLGSRLVRPPYPHSPDNHIDAFSFPCICGMYDPWKPVLARNSWQDYTPLAHLPLRSRSAQTSSTLSHASATSPTRAASLPECLLGHLRQVLQDLPLLPRRPSDIKLSARTIFLLPPRRKDDVLGGKAFQQKDRFPTPALN